MNQLNLFIELTRLRKPIGFMLLFWPCAWGLTISYDFTNNLNTYYFYLFLFLSGSILMRSAGCIINDITDRKFDNKVERTKNRPIASGKVSINLALFYALTLCTIAFLVLINFNLLVIILAIGSMPFAFTYPLMKRYTYWPQLCLGLIFSWGILIVSVEFYNKINFHFLLLYISCIFWTLGYDTIYAYQDREDDLQNNIKSTAVLFGSKGNFFVIFVYSIFFLIIGFLGYKSSSSFLSIMVIIPFIFAMIIYLNKWNLNSKNSSNYYFKFNNVIGLFCFVFLMIF